MPTLETGCELETENVDLHLELPPELGSVAVVVPVRPAVTFTEHQVRVSVEIAGEVHLAPTETAREGS